MHKKSTNLINAGTEQVIWILTDTRLSLVFRKNAGGKIIPDSYSWDTAFSIVVGKPIQVEIEKWIIDSGEGYILERFEE